MNDAEPLFLDEPEDLPTLERRDNSDLDLFADEQDVAGSDPASPLLPAAMPAVSRPRTAVLLAVILAGSAAGFALVYVLLN